MQSQIMGELSAGQKARIVFAIISWERPHLLLFDEVRAYNEQQIICFKAACNFLKIPCSVYTTKVLT
jgi:ABC-type polysaccharide/polyol phosphate transport system ATPase subunit